MEFGEEIFAATLFVTDLTTAKAFYIEVFDKTPVFEDPNSVVFQFGTTLINLLEERAAPELIAPASVAKKESGSRFQMTIKVADANLQAERLSALGVQLVNGPMDRWWGVRTLLFADPDGHLWEFAQDL
jgi:catechol 2,3-dioxygenase-like lactoylglutathione lyase family enzyme